MTELRNMNYVECDVPDGVTLTEWRRARHADRPTRRRRAWHFWR